MVSVVLFEMKRRRPLAFPLPIDGYGSDREAFDRVWMRCYVRASMEARSRGVLLLISPNGIMAVRGRGQLARIGRASKAGAVFVSCEALPLFLARLWHVWGV